MNEPSTSFDPDGMESNNLNNITDTILKASGIKHEKSEDNLVQSVDEKENVETPSVTEPEPEEIKYFKCYLCQLEEQYDYFGNDPPFAKKFVMEEDCYIIVDPFMAPRKGEFLTLGSNCSVCNQSVCKDSECSFYYLKTYCIKCLRRNEKKFPEFLQEKIKRILK